MSDGHAVDARELLRRSSDRQVSFRLPSALDQRLDDLLERAISAGENSSRRELVAAILLSTEADGEELTRILRHYRTATVKEALLDSVDSENVIQIRRHKPGPRVSRR